MKIFYYKMNVFLILVLKEKSVMSKAWSQDYKLFFSFVSKKNLFVYSWRNTLSFLKITENYSNYVMSVYGINFIK